MLNSNETIFVTSSIPKHKITVHQNTVICCILVVCQYLLPNLFSSHYLAYIILKYIMKDYTLKLLDPDAILCFEYVYCIAF